MPYTLVNQNPDTVVLNVRGKLPEEITTALDRIKEFAQEAEDVVPTPWEFLGQTLYCRPNGSGRQWRWVLFCGDHYLHLDLGTGKLNNICAKVRCSSLLLHEKGLADTLGAVYAFLVHWQGRERFELQVSEVHLCVDVAGWSLTDADTRCFVSRATPHDIPEEEVQRIPETTRRGRKIQALEFSKKAPHSCVLYDKLKESRIHHKEWFAEVWKQNGWDGESPVLRIECRYEREWLREHQVEEPYAMLDQLAGMWAYSTQLWLRHVQPTSDRNQSRWETSPVWQLVQSATFEGDPTPLARHKKVELDTERAKAGYVGYATSWALREVALYNFQHAGGVVLQIEDLPEGLPLSAVDESGGGFLAWSFDEMQDYLAKRKGATFVDLMLQKAKRLGLKLKA